MENGSSASVHFLRLQGWLVVVVVGWIVNSSDTGKQSATATAAGAHPDTQMICLQGEDAVTYQLWEKNK